MPFEFDNETLQSHGLNEVQLKAVNDATDDVGKLKAFENAIAGNRTSNIYSGLDNDFTALTGMAKNQGEKSIEFYKRVLPGYAESQVAAKVGELTTQLEAAKTGLQAAEEKLKNHPGDEGLKAEIEAWKEKEKTFTTALSEKDVEWQKKYDEQSTEISEYKFNQSISKFLPKEFSIKDQEWIDHKVSNAVNKLKSDYDINYNEQGEMVITKDYNKIDPKEFFSNELKEIIKVGPPGGGGSDFKAETLDFATAKSKSQVDEMFTTQWEKSGKSINDKEYATEKDKVLEQYKDLPLR